MCLSSRRSLCSDDLAHSRGVYPNRFVDLLHRGAFRKGDVQVYRRGWRRPGKCRGVCQAVCRSSAATSLRARNDPEPQPTVFGSTAGSDGVPYCGTAGWAAAPGTASGCFPR